MTSTITDACSRRGITRVVHCHADHFEPEGVAGVHGAGANVALWLERSRPAVPTLFVKCPIGFRLDNASEIGMRLKRQSTAAIEAGYLRTLVGLGGVGVGLHVHHEAWTCNTMSHEKLSKGQQKLHDRAMRSEDLDGERMSAMVKGSLAWLRETTGLALTAWDFVHGCWAFGASDPEICRLVDEIPILHALGCRADFSFPAGRRYCDPRWDRPKWITPVPGIRAFELPEADPRDEHAPDRLLVWASPADSWWLCLDTYTADSRQLTESDDKIERHLELCPVVNGTAYVKTCAHGMNPYYWQDNDPRPTVGVFASELAAKCSEAGVPVEFLTTELVVAELALDAVPGA